MVDHRDHVDLVVTGGVHDLRHATAEPEIGLHRTRGSGQPRCFEGQPLQGVLDVVHRAVIREHEEEDEILPAGLGRAQR